VGRRVLGPPLVLYGKSGEGTSHTRKAVMLPRGGLRGGDARNRCLRPFGLQTSLIAPLRKCAEIGARNPHALRRGFILTSIASLRRRPPRGNTTALRSVGDVHRFWHPK